MSSSSTHCTRNWAARKICIVLLDQAQKPSGSVFLFFLQCPINASQKQKMGILVALLPWSWNPVILPLNLEIACSQCVQIILLMYYCVLISVWTWIFFRHCDSRMQIPSLCPFKRPPLKATLPLSQYYSYPIMKHSYCLPSLRPIIVSLNSSKNNQCTPTRSHLKDYGMPPILIQFNLTGDYHRSWQWNSVCCHVVFLLWHWIRSSMSC